MRFGSWLCKDAVPKCREKQGLIVPRKLFLLPLSNSTYVYLVMTVKAVRGLLAVVMHSVSERPPLPIPNSIGIKGISNTLYIACPYLMALCLPHTCCLFNSTGQLCFVQHLSSCGGCRTLPAQGKTPSLELQTRKMETVCLISICLCYVLERMKLQMSPGCGHFLTVPKPTYSC